MTGRLAAVAALAALELAVVWGHRLPVLRWAAGALAALQRSAGLFVSRSVLLLPAAMAAVAVVHVVRRRELRRVDVALTGLLVVLGAAVVLTTYLLTRR